MKSSSSQQHFIQLITLQTCSELMKPLNRHAKFPFHAAEQR